MNHLKEYLQAREMSQVEFARMIEQSPQTVSRYVKGERIPDPEPMRKIFEATKGKIDANSFYGIDRRKRKVQQ